MACDENSLNLAKSNAWRQGLSHSAGHPVSSITFALECHAPEITAECHNQNAMDASPDLFLVSATFWSVVHAKNPIQVMLANPFKYRTCIVSWRGDSVRIRSYRKDHITRAFKRGHYYEQEFLQMIAETCSSSGVFVDVGAFVGNHSLFFARHCRPVQVIAFEPFPETFDLLQYNVFSQWACRRNHLHQQSRGG